MWALKILKGPKAGTSFPLRDGGNVIGRSGSAQITLPTQGISKEHASLIVQGNTLVIKDLNSTNGTFVNGVRIREQRLKPGDKILLFDCILEIQIDRGGASLPAVQGNLAVNPDTFGIPQQHTMTSTLLKKNANLSQYGEMYIKNALLPGIYKLGESFEFTWAIGLFVAAFVVVTTVLSVIPMVEITRSSLQTESFRRAETIAETLRDRYSDALRAGTDSTFDSGLEREDGVDTAVVVNSSTGKILAPARRIGESINKTFVHEARKKDEIVRQSISTSLLGVSLPIRTFSRETGEQKVTAHAIVIYDMSSVAIDFGRILSLFVQVFTISLLLGFILYYFLKNFVDFPISSLNKQLNRVLKNELDTVSVTYQYENLQSLATNVNSLIHRSKNPISSQGSALVDRTAEASELLAAIPLPGLALDKDSKVITANAGFEGLIGRRGLDGSEIDDLGDQAFILSLKDLIDRSKINVQGLTNNLEFSGQNYEVLLRVIHSDSDVAFYIVLLKPQGGGFDV